MSERIQQRVEIDGGVAVGVDGSASSLRALELAAEETRRRGTTLHVVRAWSMRTVPRPPDCPPGATPTIDEYETSVTDTLRHVVETAIGTEPGFPVEYHVAHSPSPQALLSASRGAHVLVVGHRGRGGFSGLMLGSVAEQCVRHAACPILVVRPSY
ncbi:universal stress protein [Allosaccharopolyspora coralli]|uniref:universal stress protein n=1 Tax=Allosaccharopolyspora coralli TaxID=2665642 RepID=UPI001E446162|nr:universal stress protein [Allosaccharopolyspora coralli]